MTVFYVSNMKWYGFFLLLLITTDIRIIWAIFEPFVCVCVMNNLVKKIVFLTN